MYKFVLLVIGTMALAGCGQFNRSAAILSGFQAVCVNGVSYLQFPSGASVEYTPEGKIKACK